jgi:putative acetyltransferase
MSGEVRIAEEDPGTPEARALLDAGAAYAASLYPAESNHILDVEALRRPNVAFLMSRIDGRAVGCGAVVDHHAEYGEVKRLYVAPEARGRGVGARLLEMLEATARHRGLSLMRLETGTKQPEALALYRRMGYREIPSFGEYQPDPLSIFMEKRLAHPPS